VLRCSARCCVAWHSWCSAARATVHLATRCSATGVARHQGTAATLHLRVRRDRPARWCPRHRVHCVLMLRVYVSFSRLNGAGVSAAVQPAAGALVNGVCSAASGTPRDGTDEQRAALACVCGVLVGYMMPASAAGGRALYILHRACVQLYTLGDVVFGTRGDSSDGSVGGDRSGSAALRVSSGAETSALSQRVERLETEMWKAQSLILALHGLIVDSRKLTTS
jgi:hypothetical protein